MKIIQIYTDECIDKSFKLYSSIWGSPENCKLFSIKIRQTLNGNIKIASNFKGLHANKLNANNWSALGKIFQQVLNELFEFEKYRKLNFHITLFGRNKYDSNVGYLKKYFGNQLYDRASVVGKLFKDIPENDLPALYHRMDELFIYLYYRDKFGDAGVNFEFYPDSFGNILNYQNKVYLFAQESLIFLTHMGFFDMIIFIGNVLSRSIDKEGWPTIKQHLIKFEPQKIW